MASDIKIEVIENVLQETSEENVIEVSTQTSVVEVHNADGLNGITPHIGENGNWFIGTTDTGVHAQGEKGEQGESGLTPYIGANGNWFVGDVDLGVKAQGEQGIQGVQGEKGDKGDKGDNGVDGTNGKSAYDYAVEGGFKGTEEEFVQSLNNLNEIKNIMPLVYAGL
jgi:hypothetical protein